MPRTLQLRAVTNEGVAFAEEAVSVRAPGELGNLGMLYNHAPLVTTLVPGTLWWRRPGGEQRQASIGQGLLEIVHNHVTVLTDSVSEPTDCSLRQGTG